MIRKLPLLAALLLAPAAAASASAQASHSGGVVSSASPQASRAQVNLGYTGVNVGFLASVSPEGVLTQSHPTVRAVAPGSPGEQVGIRQGDVIIEVNGRDSREDRALWLEAGVRYTLRLRTGDQEREVVLVPLAERPAAAVPAT